jgi:hypothetical protein
MDQRALFYEGYREALRKDCQVIEPTPAWAKVVGKLLFPELDPDAAGRRLSDKTNPHREDRLSDEQERLIMRLAVERRGYSAAHDFITDEIGMERAKPKERRDEAGELLARGESLLAQFKAVTERFERVVRAPLSVVDTTKKSA